MQRMHLSWDTAGYVVSNGLVVPVVPATDTVMCKAHQEGLSIFVFHKVHVQQWLPKLSVGF